MNLVDNAAKFTPDGGRIWLVTKRSGDECELTIADNGIGIGSESLPDIFTLFTQGKRSLDRRQGGLGIGLALVKNLVELHGGSIRAFSKGLETGVNSSFACRCSRRRPSLMTLRPRTNGAPMSAIEFLVVDDHVGSATSVSARF